MSENNTSPVQIIEDLKLFLQQLPNVSNGNHAIVHSNFNSFGSGRAGFDKIVGVFNSLDLAENLKHSELKKRNEQLAKEVSDLESKYTDLNTIFGSENGLKQGSVAHDVVTKIQKEIDDLIIKRDDLINEVSVAEHNFNAKISEFSQKTFDEESKAELKIKVANSNADLKVKQAEAEANRKVKLINQFSDFLSETNKNMNLYSAVIIIVLLTAFVAVGCSIPKLMNTFDSYDIYVNGLLGDKTPWQVLNFAFGILIVKLPWALCLSAVLTGMYKLLKGILHTYEKINQDKRNMSAIYAVSGNVAQALNQYGLAIVEEYEDPETNEIKLYISESKVNIEQKRESLKWNQIMNYFERMQNHKEQQSDKEEINPYIERLINLSEKVALKASNK